jgi:S1-C subfamily serine protease
MKQLFFFVAVFLQCLQGNALEYAMLENATLQSQVSNNPIGSSLDHLLEQAIAAVCCICVESEDMSIFQRWWYGEQKGMGTGFFVSPQGHFITNKHVIEVGSKVTVFSSFSSCGVKASIIAEHPTEDVALLKMDDLINFPFSYLSISSMPGEIGDWVFAPRVRGICPQFDHLLIMPSLGKIIGTTTLTDPTSSLSPLLSMGIVRGNSGTPILNLEGNVIGIATRIACITTDDPIITLMVSVDSFSQWLKNYTEHDSRFGI